MPAYRYFCTSEMNVDDLIDLIGSEGRHATLVMRCEKGDFIELIDGMGALARAQIIGFIKCGMRVQIVDIVKCQRPRFGLHLIQMMPRWEALGWIVEKATELGVASIAVILNHRAKEKLTPQRQQRLQNITVSALKQSGGLFLPKLEFSDEGRLTARDLSGRDFFADLACQPLMCNRTKPKAANSTLRVGPEGGFSPAQKKAMLDVGVLGISLHKHTLRCETAAICGLMVLYAEYRD